MSRGSRARSWGWGWAASLSAGAPQLVRVLVDVLQALSPSPRRSRHASSLSSLPPPSSSKLMTVCTSPAVTCFDARVDPFALRATRARLLRPARRRSPTPPPRSHPTLPLPKAWAPDNTHTTGALTPLPRVRLVQLVPPPPRTLAHSRTLHRPRPGAFRVAHGEPRRIRGGQSCPPPPFPPEFFFL